MWEWSHDDSLEIAAREYEAKTGESIDFEQARVEKHVGEISDLVVYLDEKNTPEINRSLDHISQWSARYMSRTLS